MSEKKLVGICMDMENATVVKNDDIENAFMFFICEPVKRIVQGGNSSEKKANNSEISNIAKFFKDLEHLITNTQEIYLTGTGVIQEQFKRHLSETAQFKNLKVTLGTDQKISPEQFLEEVKQRFNA